MAATNEPAGVGLIQGEHPHGLSGHMGVLELIFTVVAYNGPVVVFLGFMPAAVLLGNGVGTPVTFLVAGLVVLCVAVGLLRMTQRLNRPGGFYALITAGLGRTVGLGAGFAALTCYFVALISVYALGGIAFNGIITGLFNGTAVNWVIWALGILVVASVLGYLNINFSAKVLTVFLFCELLLMVAYDLSVLFQGGAKGIGFDSFSPDNVFSGSVSIAFMFAIGLFGGFEATVIFRDEVKNPLRTIPTATYGVIALLAGLYGITAWCFVNSYGAAAVMDVVTNNLTGASTDSVKEYTGEFAYDAATIMLFTSCLALVLAAHNITARYLFNLSADGIFPRKLGQAHDRHVSPHRASIVVSVASLAVLIGFTLAKVPEADLYARLAGLYSYAFLILLVLVALAIAVFLRREHPEGPANGAAAASLFACIVFAVTLVLATKNFTLLSGATGGMKVFLLVAMWGVTVTGLALAEVLKRSRPLVYERIGRQ